MQEFRVRTGMLAAAVVLVCALAPSTVAGADASSTTPGSTPPTTVPTAGAPRIRPSLHITPASGPAGTTIDFTGACGPNVASQPPANTGAWNVLFNASPTIYTAWDPAIAGRSRVLGFGGFDRATGPAVLHGSHTLESTQGDGSALVPGLYYVEGMCQCSYLTTCANGFTNLQDAQLILLPPQPFCVTASDAPGIAASTCLDNSWLTWLLGHVGATRAFVATALDLISGVGDPFAPPPPPGASPAPPAGTPTTTTRPHTTATTHPPVTSPPTQPQVTTTTFHCTEPPPLGHPECPPG